MLRRISRWLAGTAVATTALVAVSAAPAQAVQHQNANIAARWNFNGATGFWNIDQRVQVTRKARNSYWAMQWGFTSTPNEAGYMGLQTDARRPNGSTGDLAIFSLWNATNARGSSCGRFGGEGTGWSCRLPYTIDVRTDYRYRVWRLEADGGGQWWGAWVLNVRTGVEQQIGAIRVAGGKNLMTPPLNFSEYWGDAVSCDAVPRSVAVFTQPAANQQRPGVYQHGSRFAGSTRGACTGGDVHVVDLGWTRAAQTTLGGPR
ncbi:DUF3472 domain-containing protein [Actinoplanes sp. NBRC 101535]|uniref:DUF3472 domain-containing protein n=1 Tax=Actinoplanes sp. NBRC 101535 TaxID=3032196 RepID=UPI0024A0A575|nr:DUF3472 domain-containing protein [Actinoplanes sp. NBRC 101535]GLY04492.1 hypothetical protein Acsp01_48710 [Actinoplanes sp. NBRC 101535]